MAQVIEQAEVIDRVHCLGKLRIVTPRIAIDGGSYWRWACILFSDEKTAVGCEQVAMLGIASIIKLRSTVGDI